MKRTIGKWMLALMAALMFGNVLTAYAAGKEEKYTVNEEELNSEAAENYDAAKKQMEDIYYKALDRSTKQGGLFDGEPLDQKAYNIFYRTYKLIADNWIFIIGLCWIIGWPMFFLSRKNKIIQRFALFTLIIGIPLVVVLFVWGVGSSIAFERT